MIKHVLVRNIKLKSLVNDVLTYIPTKQQLADILTKAVDRNIFETLRKMLLQK